MKIKNTIIAALILSAAFFSANAQNTDIELVEQHVEFLADDALLGRGFGSPAGNEAAEYIRSQFIDAGIEPLLEDYFHKFIHRQGILNINGKNVVGIVRGNDPDLKDEYIVVGAHYDHIGWEFAGEDTVVYNGADDNASGTAAVIELGRYFASHKSELKRSVILIAFDGEESGLIGSTRFVKDSVVENDAIKAMFSIDMVGMYEGNGGIELGGIELLKEYASYIDRGTAGNSAIIKKTDASISNRTDTGPFGNAGVPAIYVSTGIRESNYHQPEDDIEFIDFEGMVTIIDFMAELVKAMSQDDELIRTNAMEAIEKSGGMKRINPGIKLNTGGTFLDYPDSYVKSKGLFATSAGLFLETRITQWLAIQPEVLYEFDGSEQAGGNLRMHSLSVPLSLILTTPDAQNNQFRVYFQAGGYFNYTFAGKIGDVAADFTNDYYDQHYGMIVGAGYEIFNVRLGYTYKRILGDFHRTADPVHGNTVLSGSYFTLGWAF